MTRQQAKQIRQATGEQLLLFAVFQGDHLRQDLDDELDRRAAVRWARGQSQVTTGRGTTESAA